VQTLVPTPAELCLPACRENMRGRLQAKIEHEQGKLPCGPDPDDVRQLNMLEALDIKDAMIADLRIRVECLTGRKD